MTAKSKSKANGVVDRLGAEFVVIKIPDGTFEKDPFEGHLPFPILLDVGAYVWVPGNEEDLLIQDVVQVTDDRSSGYGGETNIISVPEGWCTFISEKQALAIAKEAGKQSEAVA